MVVFAMSLDRKIMQTYKDEGHNVINLMLSSLAS